MYICLLSSVVEQLTRNEQVVGSTPMGGSERSRQQAVVITIGGNSSVGRASASQAEGREFDSRFPLRQKGSDKVRTFFRYFVQYAPIYLLPASSGTSSSFRVSRQAPHLLQNRASSSCLSNMQLWQTCVLSRAGIRIISEVTIPVGTAIMA